MGIDVLDNVKASLAKEKIIEETRKIVTGQNIWKRIALCQKFALVIQAEFSIVAGSHPSSKTFAMNSKKHLMTKNPRIGKWKVG